MMKMEIDKACTPQEIENRSFEIIDSEIPHPRKYRGPLWEIARRCIHACGDTAILKDLELDGKALARGMAALERGCVIYTDTRMLAAGLVARRMDRLGVRVIPLMELPQVTEQAKNWNTTRSRAGIKLVANDLADNIVAIGNAPTALLALLEELEKGSARLPALIVGMPVGFVNAVQSKEMLHTSPFFHFTLRGRKGGSPLASAAINAMADLVLRKKNTSNREPV